jgi:lipoate-protein ligase A
MRFHDFTCSTAAQNLAADEALLEQAEAGRGGEGLRFWESPEPFVVVGYGNDVEPEVNLRACREAGVPVRRRISGGGTVLQGPGCLNYALILRISEAGPTRSIRATNEFVMGRNAAALGGLLGAPVRVAGDTDLALGERKFSGNAQRRRRDFLLFHGTLLLDFELPLIGRYLREPARRPDYRAARRHDEFVMNLGVPAGRVKAALIEAWGATPAGVSSALLAEIAALAAGKYSDPDWIERSR